MRPFPLCYTLSSTFAPKKFFELAIRRSLSKNHSEELIYKP
jgi:hypothetical protein